MMLSIATFRNCRDNQPRQRERTWEDLSVVLMRHTEREEKDGPLWSPTLYKPGTVRAKANVVEVSCLVLDFDSGAGPEDFILPLRGFAAAMHTTFQHLPEAQRWRVVLPLLAPVPAAEWPHVWEQMTRHFGGNAVDPSCKDASRIYYTPSCPPGAERDAMAQDGEWLDPAGFRRPPVPILVERAMGHLGEGRNNAGMWLACQLRDNGYTQSEAERADWHRHVSREKVRPDGRVDVYDADEWQENVRRVYSTPARQPWRPAATNGAAPEKLPPERNPAQTRAKRVEDDALGEAWATGQRDHFLFAEGDEWWEYDGNAWTSVSDSTVHAHMAAWLKQRTDGKQLEVRQRRVREMAFVAATLLGAGRRPVPRSRFNADPNLVPLQNGMLDLETRDLRAHSPDYRNTYCLPYAYDPKADCPRYKRFLKEVMLTEEGEPCQEWISTLEEWSGYCLTPDSRAETVLVNVGEGGNGKSLWAKVLEGLIGDVNCVSIDPRQLEMQPGYTLASLYGKLVGFLNEPTRTQIQGCSGSLKAIVSGDVVQARHPAGRPFSYRPHVRLVVSANDVPDTKDLSRGFFRRLLVIEWRFRPPDPDPHLDRKLLAELPGILNVALDGLDRLRARGGDFPEPAESQTLKQEYRFDQDSAAQFLRTERVEVNAENPELWCKPSLLYQEYASWCKKVGYQPMTITAFGTHLTKRLGYPRPRSRRDSETGKILGDCRFGIRLQGWGE